jgi:hypothetical protein
MDGLKNCYPGKASPLQYMQHSHFDQSAPVARCPFHKFAASYAAARVYGLGG